MRVGFDSKRPHAAVYIHGWFWVLALSVASNHCVPSEDVWAIDLLKDFVGVGHRCGEGDETEQQMFAHIWIVERDAMFD